MYTFLELLGIVIDRKITNRGKMISVLTIFCAMGSIFLAIKDDIEFNRSQEIPRKIATQEHELFLDTVSCLRNSNYISILNHEDIYNYDFNENINGVDNGIINISQDVNYIEIFGMSINQPISIYGVIGRLEEPPSNSEDIRDYISTFKESENIDFLYCGIGPVLEKGILNKSYDYLVILTKNNWKISLGWIPK